MSTSPKVTDPPRSKHRWFWYSLLLVLLLAIACSWYAIRMQEAKRRAQSGGIIIRSSESLLEALDGYHSDKGQYPDRLGQLVPDYLAEIPVPTSTPNGKNRPWVYEKKRNDLFQLHATLLHWVSSYDAVVYRSDQMYPKWWEEQAQVSPLDHWVYVVGYQIIEQKEGVNGPDEIR